MHFPPLQPVEGTWETPSFPRESLISRGVFTHTCSMGAGTTASTGMMPHPLPHIASAQSLFDDPSTRSNMVSIAPLLTIDLGRAGLTICRRNIGRSSVHTALPISSQLTTPPPNTHTHTHTHTHTNNVTISLHVQRHYQQLHVLKPYTSTNSPLIATDPAPSSLAPPTHTALSTQAPTSSLPSPSRTDMPSSLCPDK
jgi:hypothetical protein